MTTIVKYGPPSRRGETSARNHGRSPSHKWLLLQLRRLLAKSNAENPGCPPPPDLPDEDLSEWEDDHYAYFQYDLPGRIGPDIDICVHGGMAMIRVEKGDGMTFPPREP